MACGRPFFAARRTAGRVPIERTPEANGTAGALPPADRVTIPDRVPGTPTGRGVIPHGPGGGKLLTPSYDRRAPPRAQALPNPPTQPGTGPYAPSVARVLSSSEGSNRGAFSPADWALFAGLSLVWGSSYLFIALGLEAFTPGVITWGRVALGAATVWLVPRARRQVARSDWPRLVVISFTWTAIPFTLFPLAQQWIASALAGMLNGVTPLAAAVISSAMLRRTPGRAQLVGLVVGLVGVALIGLPSLDGGSAALGVVLVLVASALYGLSSTLAVPLVQAYGSFPVMARMLALATVWTAPLALVDLASNTATPLAVGAVLALGVVGTGLAYVMMATLSGSVGSTRASFITYVIPAVALVLGVAVLGESVAALSVAGAGLVVAGSLLAGRPDPARG